MSATRDALIERLRQHARDLVQGGTSATELRADLNDAAAALRHQAELAKLARGAWHMLQSLLAVRDGIPDESIHAMCNALQGAVDKAEGGNGRE